MTERTNNERVTLTSAGRAQLSEEASRLEVRLAELRELLEEAHADRTADDDERAAALGLLDEHSRMEARLAEIRALLEMSADAQPVNTDVGNVGTKIKVRDEDGVEEEYTLVSAAEASPSAGRISVQSPLGKALHGRRVGEKAEVVAPSGRWQIEILAIEAAA
ncbi:MAG: hypothetical protein FJ033_11445 [Chloroflexi bacterium]|nr:hypothetical protein [Chloroflexota bacterium]